MSVPHFLSRDRADYLRERPRCQRLPAYRSGDWSTNHTFHTHRRQLLQFCISRHQRTGL